MTELKDLRVGRLKGPERKRNCRSLGTNNPEWVNKVDLRIKIGSLPRNSNLATPAATAVGKWEREIIVRWFPVFVLCIFVFPK